MKDIKFRTIEKHEIDLRVGATKKEDLIDEKTNKPVTDKNGNVKKVVVGFQLLAYKDARVDADILDSTVGAFNWVCKYYQVKNTLMCSVGININYDDPTKEPYFIYKDDAGDESNEEAIKGEARDSFKRACFRWNVCRTNLYNFPFIWINVTKENTPYSRYIVDEVEFDTKGYPTKVVVINEKTRQVVYSYGVKGNQALNEPKTPKESHSNFDNKSNVSMKELNASVKSMEDYENDYNDPLSDNSDMAYVKEYYNKLSEERKQKFEIWLFTTVQETKVEKSIF